MGRSEEGEIKKVKTRTDKRRKKKISQEKKVIEKSEKGKESVGEIKDTEIKRRMRENGGRKERKVKTQLDGTKNNSQGKTNSGKKESKEGCKEKGINKEENRKMRDIGKALGKKKKDRKQK